MGSGKIELNFGQKWQTPQRNWKKWVLNMKLKKQHFKFLSEIPADKTKGGDSKQDRVAQKLLNKKWPVRIGQMCCVLFEKEHPDKGSSRGEYSSGLCTTAQRQRDFPFIYCFHLNAIQAKSPPTVSRYVTLNQLVPLASAGSEQDAQRRRCLWWQAQWHHSLILKQDTGHCCSKTSNFAWNLNRSLLNKTHAHFHELSTSVTH